MVEKLVCEVRNIFLEAECCNRKAWLTIYDLQFQLEFRASLYTQTLSAFSPALPSNSWKFSSIQLYMILISQHNGHFAVSCEKIQSIRYWISHFSLRIILIWLYHFLSFWFHTSYVHSTCALHFIISCCCNELTPQITSLPCIMSSSSSSRLVS